MLQKMTHLFVGLHHFQEILPAQFFDDPELHFAETDACSVSFDQPGNLGMKLMLAAAVMKTVTNTTVCGISTLADLVVVQELRTQDSSADFFNKNPLARHLQICMNHGFWVCKVKVPQVMLHCFPKGWFPMLTAELF